MNDQFDNNESEVIQPNIDNTVNDVVTVYSVRLPRLFLPLAWMLAVLI